MVQVTGLPGTLQLHCVCPGPSEDGARKQIFHTFTLYNACRLGIALRILPFPWNTL